jgi:hypothetical protein
MEEFEFVGFSVVTVEIYILLECDPRSLAYPHPKFRGIFKA